MTIQARIHKNFEKQHFMSYLGAKLETIEEGRVSISVEKAAHLSQQTGFIHAGVITTIADSAAGYAAWSMMPENSDVLSVEFKVNLMRPASGSKIIAHAQVIKSGRQITVVEADVEDVDTGKVIAKFQGTMISVPAQTE
ncbi:MAG TPA: PaaI family thioesterase [Atopostipes sp.]|jgi:uncharacterized protein (TIGR00369 family)|nr:PaaI family thioesterase [Clostridiaceae bacterium]HZK47245.1 PaaI family thioesterase [Atopostipes sp.]